MTNQVFIYMGLGFAAASLLAVLLSQILYRRAYKAAAKNLRGQIPLNQSELNAERDRLRAEFAVNLNKLEYKVAAMQQSELKLRIDATLANEQKLQIQDTLNTYIKKAVRWEAAHENVQNIANILTSKLKLQSDRVDNLQDAEVKFKAEQNAYKQAKLNSEITEVKYQKLENAQETTQRQLKTSEVQLSRVTKEHNLQAIELEEAQKNNLIYEAKISEISTQMLFLSQELFAKKISLDLSEKAIDKYKNKLLTQKLQMRDAAHKGLAAQFADHGRTNNLERTYQAIIWSNPPKSSAVIETRIGRSPNNRIKMSVLKNPQAGRHAVTHYTIVKELGKQDRHGSPVASLIECRLETGRTHQIRVHMAHIGCPLLGDPLYGMAFQTRANKLSENAQQALIALDRQALHAKMLGFDHPITGEHLKFENDLPLDMQNLISAIQNPIEG